MTRHYWIVGLLIGFGLAGSAVADAPPMISHQGVLMDSAGVVVPDGLYTVDFDILDAPVPGNTLFHQQLQLNVIGGVYNVLLSNNGSSPMTLEDTFRSPNTYLRLTIVAGPNGFPVPQTLSPSQKLASVPYAINALSSGVVAATNSARIAATTITGTAPITVQAGTLQTQLSVPAAGGVLVADASAAIAAPTGDGAARLELRVNSGSGATPCRQVDRFVSGSDSGGPTPIRCVIPNAEAGKTYTFTLFITKLSGNVSYGDGNNSGSDSDTYIDAIWYPGR